MNSTSQLANVVLKVAVRLFRPDDSVRGSFSTSVSRERHLGRPKTESLYYK